MGIQMIIPLTNEDGRHAADDITYLCPQCGTEVQRTVPVSKGPAG
jgi:predicted RNA-binding Zn-ribbon protein involved in translation (DUF1610 family)